MVDKYGENLIFLISQPRSGSTMLQRILGCHPAILTMAEPWLLLYPLYGLKQSGTQAEYDGTLAGTAVLNFLNSLPGGVDNYYTGVRRMYTYLYQQALSESGKALFLDKTPRYYYIIPEIIQTFPKAKIILLLRNPLAVLNSIYNTWSPLMFFNFKDDLLVAPALISMASKEFKQDIFVVRYEDLVNDPQSKIQQLCSHLDISFVPEMIEYGITDQGIDAWRYGDKESVNQYARPLPNHADAWMAALKKPQVWRLMNDYLKCIEPDVIEEMGYSFSEMIRLLKDNRPTLIQLAFTFTLNWTFRPPRKRNSAFRRLIARLYKSIEKRGFLNTAKRGMDLIPSSKH
jgi:hypothetical protein